MVFPLPNKIHCEYRRLPLQLRLSIRDLEEQLKVARSEAKEAGAPGMAGDRGLPEGPQIDQGRPRSLSPKATAEVPKGQQLPPPIVASASVSKPPLATGLLRPPPPPPPPPRGEGMLGGDSAVAKAAPTIAPAADEKGYGMREEGGGAPPSSSCAGSGAPGMVPSTALVALPLASRSRGAIEGHQCGNSLGEMKRQLIEMDRRSKALAAKAVEGAEVRFDI